MPGMKSFVTVSSAFENASLRKDSYTSGTFLNGLLFSISTNLVLVLLSQFRLCEIQF